MRTRLALVSVAVAGLALTALAAAQEREAESPSLTVRTSVNQQVCTIVDRVAHQHLDLAEARREFKGALSDIGEFAQRDPIETAHNHVRAASEEAYFYAGLAFGLTFAEFRSLSVALSDPATRGPARGKRHGASN